MIRSRKSIATNRGRRENGVALLMVLWVLMLLTVIVGEFCFTMRTRVNITRNFKESTEAYYLALAGLNRAVLEIIRQELTPPRIVRVEEKETEAETPDAAAPEWRMNLELPAMAFANGVFEARIENQSGKVNLNMADKPLLSTMLEGFALDPADRDVIVDSILDWRDSDRNHRINGAEDDYYQSLPEPYDCKDADFDSPEELLLVRGVTPELYKAGLKDLITVLPKNKKSAGIAGSKKKRPSGIFGSSKKEGEFDYNKLNVNAISPETWAALPGMTEELVAEIFAFRAERDFRSLGEVQEIVGADVFQEIAARLTLETTPYYKVSSFGAAGGGPIREGVSAVVEFNRNAPLYYRIMEWSEGISQ
jgi:general secretion pathway protein K